MMRRLLVLLLLTVAIPAAAQDRASQRYSPGNSLCISGVMLDACAPSYNPPSGNYNILYTGSGSPKGTDDFNILIFTGSAPAIYTFPASTSSVFPPGHGAGIKNLGIAPLTVTATTSTISGAPGVINGSPASIGGPFVLLPGGEAWLQATSSNNYLVTGFVAGTWFQYANNVPSLQWTGLSGYAEYDLHCSGILPATSTDGLQMQLAYAGTFQTSGYKGIRQFNSYTAGSGTAPAIYPQTGTAMGIADGILNTGASSEGATIQLHLTFANGTGGGNKNSVSGFASFVGSYANDELLIEESFAGPYSTSSNVTGIKIFNGGAGSNIASGLCWLRPSL
jgi:hypothetical protein